MKPIYLLLTTFLIAGVWLSFLLLPRNLKKGSQIEINGQKLSVEIADSPVKKAKGLSGRKSLPEDQAMLFIYQNPTIPKFWMKEMKFAIDIVWIKGGKVLQVSKNVSPENLPFPKTISPEKQVDSVLEITAGMAEKLAIKPGDKIILNP